jgi:hypothetical protein
MLIHKLAPDINMNKLINYSVEQNPFWEADSFVGCQEMFRIYATRRITTVYKSSLLLVLSARWISASFLASHSGVAENSIPGIDAASYPRQGRPLPMGQPG